MGIAPPRRQAAALELLFAGLPAPERAAHVAGLIAAARANAISLDGLCEARREGRLVGAAWAQVQPGGSAGVWPPRLAPAEPETTADLLFAKVLDFLSKQRVRMAQSLVPTGNTADASRLSAGGFERLTDLLYMVSTVDKFPTAAPASALAFESYRDANRERFASIIERSYRMSLDCPQLNGVRSANEMLTEYRTTGVFDPTRWLLVRDAEADVGCLLLTDHPDGPHWELVYMGLVPEARGHGWGLEVVRHAQWLTRVAGREKLVLAVDAANQPAITMYECAGFSVWDRRQVYVKIFSVAGAES